MRQVQSCPPSLFGTAAEHAGLSVSCSFREPEGPQLGTRHGETHLTPGYHEMVLDVVGRGLTSRALFSDFIEQRNLVGS